MINIAVFLAGALQGPFGEVDAIVGMVVEYSVNAGGYRINIACAVARGLSSLV